jgi:hypothetical protein
MNPATKCAFCFHIRLGVDLAYYLPNTVRGSEYKAILVDAAKPAWTGRR